MTDPKVKAAVSAALTAFSKYGSFNAETLFPEVEEVFSSDDDFLDKVNALDDLFDETPQMEDLREIFFDLLLVNFFNEDVKKLEEDYLETPEWEEIEEKTLDRGTELLNILLYLNECEEEDIIPGLEDYLKEFLLVDEDEFQDEYRIYEPVIANQVLLESPLNEINKVAGTLPEDSELKELFYPMMAFFQNTAASSAEKEAIAQNAVNTSYDMAVLEILISFK